MNYPLRSLGSFIAGFLIAGVAACIFQIYGVGWYELKWNPLANLAMGVVALLIAAIPATLVFAVSVYSVNRVNDPWKASLIGGALTAVAFNFAGFISIRVENDALGLVLVWGTVLVGSILAGVYARIMTKQNVSEA